MKKVEQITSKGVLVLDCDETLSNRELIDKIIFEISPTISAVSKKFGKASRYCYVNLPTGKPVAILAKNITYLGHPHPLYTKRIQIPKSFADFYHEHCHEYDVRFMGIYSYKGNTIFVDFDAKPYAIRKANNSSAHVWTNDLYQAVTLGSFHKTDAFGNNIEIMRADKLASYLLGNTSRNPAFTFLGKFNMGYPFNQTLEAIDTIKKMKMEASRNWAQGEWPGFFLEHEFKKFVSKEEERYEYAVIEFMLNKKDDEIDLDLQFNEPKPKFFGDLKASNNTTTEVPGNDQRAMLEALDRFGRLWYLIYGYDAVKDSGDFETTKRYNHMKLEAGKWPHGKPFDELSYKTRMKAQVTFTNMIIVEINPSNKDNILRDFNQGRQPSGDARKPKFSIKKKGDIANNSIVYRWP